MGVQISLGCEDPEKVMFCHICQSLENHQLLLAEHGHLVVYLIGTMAWKSLIGGIHSFNYIHNITYLCFFPLVLWFAPQDCGIYSRRSD